jgi:tetratricopeptide (TPR) repeat protein
MPPKYYPDIELDSTPYQDHAKVLTDLGIRLAENLDTVEAAEAVLKRALGLDKHPHTMAALGLCYYKQQRFNLGRQCMQWAYDHAKRESICEYAGNLGVILLAMGEADEAEQYIKIAREHAEPNSISSYSAQWDLALLKLKTGEYEEGLQLYESRILHRGQKLYPTPPVPNWDGKDDLNDKHVCIQGEQGTGDRLLFSRYIALLKLMYPRVKISVCLGPELTPLLWDYRYICELMPSGVPWPDQCDYHIWLCSMPRLLTPTLETVPPDPGYIRQRIERDKVICKVPPPKFPAIKIGIAWTGSPSMLRNQDRTIPLKYFLELAENPRAQLYSLQMEPGRDELVKSGARSFIVDCGPEIQKEGWVGTALIMKQMDLIITTCTSVAHLAGVLNMPCWTLLCADPYWIWGTDTTTVWYPNTLLIHQQYLGDWDDVFKKVHTRLNETIAYMESMNLLEGEIPWQMPR